MKMKNVKTIIAVVMFALVLAIASEVSAYSDTKPFAEKLSVTKSNLTPLMLDGCTGDVVNGQFTQLPNLSGYFDAENHYNLEVMVSATVTDGNTITTVYSDVVGTFQTFSLTMPHCGDAVLETLINPVPNGSGGFNPTMKVGRFIANYLVPDHGGPWVYIAPQITLDPSGNGYQYIYFLK